MEKKVYRGTAEQFMNSDWSIMEQQAEMDRDLELMRKNADRYLILRRFLLNPEIENGFYHEPYPKCEADVDKAVDHFINWVQSNNR